MGFVGSPRLRNRNSIAKFEKKVIFEIFVRGSWLVVPKIFGTRFNVISSVLPDQALVPARGPAFGTSLGPNPSWVPNSAAAGILQWVFFERPQYFFFCKSLFFIEGRK